MFRRASTLMLLVIFVCNSDAKYKNYAHILESPEYKETLSLITPEKLLKSYNNTLTIYAGDKDWLNSSCHRELIILKEAIARREVWALTMLDASSQLPSGLLRGNFIDLGQYDECMAVNNGPSNNDVRAHQCSYSISASDGNVTLPVNPSLSICLPATCSAADVVAIINTTTFSWIDQLKDLKIKIISASCSPVDPLLWDLEFTACLIVVAIIVAFLVACTIIEMKQQSLEADQRELPVIKTLVMFSLRKSVSSILSTEVKKGTLPALDGIRSLSMISLVLFHQFNLSTDGAMVNTLDFVEWNKTWRSLYIVVSLFSVDTFFAVSGFLMTYLFLKQMRKHNKFNVPMYYVHRYLRMTPAIIALTIFTIIFVPKLGSGSRWDMQLQQYVTSCRTKWWPAIVHLQNFVDEENYCLHHLWYTSVDMQLFWISPLILYPLYKKPKYGLILIVALIFSSSALSAFVTGVKQLHNMSFSHDANSNVRRQVFLEMYQSVYHRAGPWLIGIFLGYEVATHDRKLNKLNATIGWLITIVCFAFCIIGRRTFADPDYEYDVVWETFYSSVSRPIWVIGICWIIYASIKNQAGFLSYILSFRLFIPFSRLSYCIYLVHFILLTANNAALKTPEYFSEYNTWQSFLNTLIMSTALAFLLSLFSEAPVLILERILFRKPESRPEKYNEKQSKPIDNVKFESHVSSNGSSEINNSNPNPSATTCYNENVRL